MGRTSATDALPLFSRALAALALGCCLAFGAAPAVGAESPADADPSFEIARYQVEGNTLLDGRAIEKILAPYTGRARTFADIEQARVALQQAFDSAGFGAVQVLLPEQELKQGMVRIQVIEARIGSVSVSGNQSFSESNIRASVPGLRVGASPNTRRIAESLHVANENPVKQTSLQMKTGAKAGEVDATLRVSDERPWKLFATLDNTGRPETGKLRLGVGYQHANVGDRDQILTLQYVTSPEKLREVGIYGLSYRIPLYSLGDSVDFFGGYSDVDSGKVADVFNVSGKGTVLGAHYSQNLRKYDNLEHKLIYGLEYRAYRNSVDYLGTELGNDVTVHPVSLGYAAQWHLAATESGLYFTLIQNIAGGSKGGDAEFEAARSGAHPDYNLVRYGVNVARTIAADWQLRAALDGQYTNKALVPGEQFGLGGADSVRGFAEREISDDKGYRAGFEIYTPEFGGSTGISGARARALLFYDMGEVRRNNALPGETDKTSIASAGAGLRFGLGKPFSVRLDYAYVVDPAGSQTRGHEQIHFSLGAVY
jgi:hemolysin activation/secretion protein